MQHVVRTTNQPDKEIEVDDREYADLKAQGLLVDDGRPSEVDEKTGTTTPKPKAQTGNAGNDK